MAAIYPDLAGRAVLVTGGASGIGAAIVRAFAGQRARIGFIDLAAAPAGALVADLARLGSEVRFEHCDLRDIPALRQAIARLRQALGPIAVLVNNAAHDERHDTLTLTPEAWDERVAVNLRHQFFAAQAVIPDMQAAGGGSIINFGSISWMIGQGGMAAYTAAKSAVLGLTRSLARDFGVDNIRVNAVAPGWIMTERQVEKWLTPEGEARLLEAQCLKRKLQPEDVARLVLFLASEEAAAITNQQYVVDGGWV
jgi:NAD(P)-dependent dehydrogenase (short-subunit alcohol dehydrogenase family)